MLERPAESRELVRAGRAGRPPLSSPCAARASSCENDMVETDCRLPTSTRPRPRALRRPQPGHGSGSLEDRGGVDLGARELELGDRPLAEEAQDAGAGERPEPVADAPVDARAARAAASRAAELAEHRAGRFVRRRTPPACLGEVRNARSVRKFEPEAQEAVRRLGKPHPAGVLLVEDQVRLARAQAVDMSHDLKLDARSSGRARVTTRRRRAANGRARRQGEPRRGARRSAGRATRAAPGRSPAPAAAPGDRPRTGRRSSCAPV